MTAPPDPSHDDVSNPGPKQPDSPVVDNDAHDRNDDGPGGPDQKPEKGLPADTPEMRIPGKPISDMAPPGQDALEGQE